MKTKVLFNCLLISVISIPFFFSCNSGEKEEEKANKDSLVSIHEVINDFTTDTALLDDETIERIEFIISTIPNPSKVIDNVKKQGIPYNPDLINPISEKSKYVTNLSQALNVGIYGSDIGYAIIYDQTQEIITYFKVSCEIANQMGIPVKFANNIYTRYEKNKDNNDSLKQIASDIYTQIDSTLKINKSFIQATMVMSGGWIEALYIATQSVKKNPTEENKKMFYEKIKEYRNYINDLLEVLQNYKNVKEYMQIITDLGQVQEKYNLVADQQKYDEAAVTQLTEKVEQLRNKIVSE